MRFSGSYLIEVDHSENYALFRDSPGNEFIGDKAMGNIDKGVEY
jgi:hypothetical protein